MPIRTYYGRLRKRYTAEDVQANVQRRMLRWYSGIESAIQWRGGAGASANSASAAVTLPASVAVGDGMLLLLGIGSPTTTATDPAGWPLLDARDATNIRGRLYQRVAQPGDASSTVTIPLSATAKWSLVVATWAGTGAATVVAGEASTAETAAVATHTTPTLNAPTPGVWEVQAVVDRGTVTASTTIWTPPAVITKRVETYLAGTSCASAAIGDAATPVTGVIGGDTWTSDFASVSEVSFTVALLPAGAPEGLREPVVVSQYAAYF